MIADIITWFATGINNASLWAVYFVQVGAHFLTSPFIASAAIETGKLIAVTLVLFGLAMAYPRTRRASVALLRFTKRYSPRWAIPVLTVTAFFPGQADEIVVIAIVLVPILANARKRTVFTRYLQYAWRG